MRSAAVSAEGRIEPSDGTLMCSYHGWRFSGDGQCTDVPQSVDAKANAAACASPRSCAVSRPLKASHPPCCEVLVADPARQDLMDFLSTIYRACCARGQLLLCMRCMQVLQGMVFVWGSSGPNARAESEARPVPGMPDMESTQTTPKRDIDGRSCVNSLPVSLSLVPAALFCRHFPTVSVAMVLACSMCALQPPLQIPCRPTCGRHHMDGIGCPLQANGSFCCFESCAHVLPLLRACCWDDNRQ